MIWIWIGIALLLSKLMLGKKRISPEHYIWMLLPIDMYGVTVAGVTFKPYMIFAFFLLLRMMKKSKRTMLHFDGSWLLGAFVLITLVITVNLVNSSSLNPAKSAVMILLVFICAVIYISSVETGTISQMSDVMVATAIGYGIVFIVCGILLDNRIGLEGTYTIDRRGEGVFLRFDDMIDGTYARLLRLRGFMIDPNVLICNFIYAIPTAIMNFAAKRERIRSVLTILICYECLVYCNSRMGILSAAGVALIAFMCSYKNISFKARRWLLVGLCAAVLWIIFSDDFTEAVDRFMSMYTNRSGLTDEHGRFTIWREVFDALMGQKPLLGVGLNQIKDYTVTGKECHNTWLEWICSSGLILGSAMGLYFAAALFTGFRRAKYYRETGYYPVYWSILLGTTGTVVALVSVDNVTNSYLWFGVIVLTAMWTKFRPTRVRISGGNADALARTS